MKQKNRTLKCLKRHYSTVRSMKNIAVLTEDGAFALFFCPHPGGFESSIVPTSRSLPSKAKKMLMPGGGINYAESPKPTQFLPRKQHLTVCGLESQDQFGRVRTEITAFLTYFRCSRFFWSHYKEINRQSYGR